MADRVLVVDDERVIASTLSLILTSYGYEARPAYSGEEALEMSREFLPDILLSDFEMPGIDGIDLITKVRRFLPGCRALLITGRAGYIEKLGQSHDIRVIQKPVPPADLIELLRIAPEPPAPKRLYRVLLVEDHETKRYSVSRWLLRNGFEVREADCKARIPETQQTDCILLDIHLPDGNGFDICRSLRRAGVTAPIIHFSASIDGENVVAESNASGADAFLSSCVEPERLVFIIRQLIQRHLLQHTNLPS